MHRLIKVLIFFHFRSCDLFWNDYSAIWIHHWRLHLLLLTHALSWLVMVFPLNWLLFTVFYYGWYILFSASFGLKYIPYFCLSLYHLSLFSTISCHNEFHIITYYIPENCVYPFDSPMIVGIFPMIVGISPSFVGNLLYHPALMPAIRYPGHRIQGPQGHRSWARNCAVGRFGVECNQGF